MSDARMNGTETRPARLVLVRHGETDWNQERRLQGRTDNPLNGVGRAQARKAGRLLAAEPWDVVVSSPLLRAVQTAHLIADAAGLQPAGTIPELVERDYGSAEGLAPERADRTADHGRTWYR